MTYAVRGLVLIASLVLASALAACSLTQSDSKGVTLPATPPATYVYVQQRGLQGGPVYGFRASSTGQLTTISGSPFNPAGHIVGATPTAFFTLDNQSIHSYGIGADGAIGSQLSQAALFDNTGSECPIATSDPLGAVLDNTRQYIYVLLICVTQNLSAEYQTYRIDNSGAFIFNGDTVQNWGAADQYNPPMPGIPSILGNETFAYSDVWDGHLSRLMGFRRTSAGTLQIMQFTEADPACCDGYYEVNSPDASPTGDYLVAQYYPADTNPPQFVSYRVDANGNLSTTNTPNNMPTSSLTQPQTTFSPSGNLFVAYSGGIEIYKFNGADPLTLWQTLLHGNGVTQVAFDIHNHLYAMSGSVNKLYAFTVTPSSVTEDSSISVASPPVEAPFDMVVGSR